MHTALRLKNPILLMALAAAYPVVVHGAGAARVDFASGPVVAVSGSGTERPLTKGAEVSDGDTIRTGDDGRVQLRFTDGAMMSLQPKTEFRIDAYRYSGSGDGEAKGFFNLLKGGLRTITGLIGRSNREAYRVSTQVATIGIRGTEYSAAYTDASSDALLVHTGEGRIEVCNGGGCLVVSGGESAYIGGSDKAPARTGSQPLLRPAQPEVIGPVAYAAGETRTATGGVPLLSTPLPSGTGYAAFFAGLKAGSPVQLSDTGTATFGSASELQRLTSASNDWLAGSVSGAYSADGVIGWGTWKTGTLNAAVASFPLADMHYVVGVPTPSADLAALSGMTATYGLAGYTHPTTSTGVTGTDPVSGTLTASFGGTTSLTVDMTVPVAGTVHTFSGSAFASGTSPYFSGSPASCTNCSGASISGFFAGQNASHAGLTYQFTSSNAALGTVSGAAAYTRTGP